MLKNPNYIYGAKGLSVPVHLNAAQYILDKLHADKELIAFINGLTDERITYGEIVDQAMSVALSLKRMGIGKGHTVAICSENRNEFWSAVLGTMCTGAVLTTLNVIYTKDEIKHVTNISKPSVVFVSPVVYPLQEKNLKAVTSIKKVIIFGDTAPSNEILFKDLLEERVNYEDFQVADVNGQSDTVFILYSSGTTGLPKGVMQTHYNVLTSCRSLEVEIDPQPQVILGVAPWFHAMGLLGTLGALCKMRTTVYIPKFDEKLYFETIQKYRPGRITVVPPVLVLLSKSQLLDQYDVSSVEYIYCGAAMIDVDTIQDVKKRMPRVVTVLQGYGLTESTLAVTKDYANTEVPFREGSVGLLGQELVAKIVDLETGKALGPHQQGEMRVKGPMVMKGYVGKNISEELDEEGFLKTGDIAYYDEDKYFYIVDRLKELIKYKGYQVPPAEIEAVLLQHKAVRDAAVIGIPKKSVGEVPLAFVVLQPGETADDKDIQEFVASQLSNPKHLRGGVRFIDEIPKNASGKILRRKLREMVQKGKSKL